MIRYTPGANAAAGVNAAKRLFGEKYDRVRHLTKLLRDMDTEQSEIVATIFASWNDLLLSGDDVADEEIIDDVRTRWHERKARFPKARLQKALQWMRANSIVPTGRGVRTRRGSQKV
jgi:type I restriction enzyme, S subunit